MKEQDYSINKTNKKSTAFKISIAVLITFSIIISFVLGFFTRYWTQSSNANTVSWIISTIDNSYCVYDEDTGEIRSLTAKDYANTLVNGLLDKYSKYYTAEEYTDVISTSQGNYFGVGLRFLVAEELPIIHSVTFNSPADVSGIEKGDLICSGKTTEGVSVFSDKNQVLEFLSERKNGEEFSLFLTRGGEFTEREFILKKQPFVASYIEYCDSEKKGVFRTDSNNVLKFTAKEEENSLLNEDTAIITFSSFEGGAAKQLSDAISYMTANNRSKLILDLRDNGGGYMDILTEVASYLTYNKGGSFPVAYAKDKNNNESVFLSTGSNFNDKITSISVIANENTASASECLIGAMLYYKKCFDLDKLVVVNSSLTEGKASTYGKGIMQTTYSNYITGEALKLTTAYIFQPDKVTSIHGIGIKALPENSFTDNNLALIRAISIV